ncbi:helix-turn-helix domain-containing protein [Streptomyces sp. NPDC051018]|uniref:helix-turn-helix domain-containing protein n=1 Tax=Streptomyces sp. NPDC051018 TaxID=3365639 RepID=UPI00378B411B
MNDVVPSRGCRGTLPSALTGKEKGGWERVGSIEQTVAANLRRLRKRSGMSLSDMARHTGLAKSTFTNLESGTGNPTLQTLWSIAEALGCTLADVIHEQIPQVLRADEGARVDSESSRGRIIAQIPVGTGVDVYEVTFLPGQTHNSSGGRPGMTEYLYVIDGRVSAGVPGQEETLGPGDTYRLPEEPYRIGSLDDVETKTILLIANPTTGPGGR